MPVRTGGDARPTCLPRPAVNPYPPGPMCPPLESVFHVAACVALWGAVACGQDRIALLPPIDFNLDQDSFANEPLSDADP